MIKVGLIGVPSSGKTELADAISKRITGPSASPSIIWILDKIPERASEEMNSALGFSGSWHSDLGISLTRIGQERYAEEAGADVCVTCGTLIDSTVYSMIRFESRMKFKQDNELEDEAKRVQSSMMTNACLYMDTFYYDRLYFLNQIGPVKEDAELFTTLDKQLRSSFEAFGIVKTAKELIVETSDMTEATEQRMAMIEEDLEEIERKVSESNNSQGRDVEPEGDQRQGVQPGA
jgi:hypothetical protein